MTDDPLIGRQLDEYLLEELLGQGGMARVYRAVDIRLKRYVAIKVIDSGHRADSDYARRFNLEAQAIARLTHPNIVHLYRYGRTNDDLLYMAMQYIEGMNLGTLLQGYWADGEFMALDDASRVVGQVCDALDYAHAQGVIHRDIKPANIMLDRQGNVHLADFGLVLLTEVGTRGEIFGTPHYIAPEQAISSASASPQSDLYSVGVILYEMFTGALPFDADDPLEVAMLHMTATPRSPRELRAEITPGLAAVILTALEKEPPERYQTGAQLSQALNEALRAKKAAQMRTSRKTVYSRVIAAVPSLPLPPGTQPSSGPAPATQLKMPPVTRPETAPSTQPKIAPITRPETSPPAKPKAAAPTKKTEPRMYLPEIPVPEPPPFATSAPPFIASAPPSPPTPAPLIAEPAPSHLPLHVPSNPSRPSWLIPSVISGGLLVVLLCAAFLGRSWLRGRTSDVATATPTAASVVETHPAATAEDSLQPPATDTAPATPLAAAAPARLLIARGKEESVWIINQGVSNFALAPLLLKSGEKSVAGDVWGVAVLKPDECVVILQVEATPKDEPKDAPKEAPREAPHGCTSVGGWELTREKKDLFGRSSIEVFYGGERVQECREKECLCDIVSSTP